VRLPATIIATSAKPAPVYCIPLLTQFTGLPIAGVRRAAIRPIAITARETGYQKKKSSLFRVNKRKSTRDAIARIAIALLRMICRRTVGPVLTIKNGGDRSRDG
jgi:hypothetical protein